MQLNPAIVWPHILSAYAKLQQRKQQAAGHQQGIFKEQHFTRGSPVGQAVNQQAQRQPCQQDLQRLLAQGKRMKCRGLAKLSGRIIATAFSSRR